MQDLDKFLDNLIERYKYIAKIEIVTILKLIDYYKKEPSKFISDYINISDYIKKISEYFIDNPDKLTSKSNSNSKELKSYVGWHDLFGLIFPELYLIIKPFSVYSIYQDNKEILKKQERLKSIIDKIREIFDSIKKEDISSKSNYIMKFIINNYKSIFIDLDDSKLNDIKVSELNKKLNKDINKYKINNNDIHPEFIERMVKYVDIGTIINGQHIYFEKLLEKAADYEIISKDKKDKFKKLNQHRIEICHPRLQYDENNKIHDKIELKNLIDEFFKKFG